VASAVPDAGDDEVDSGGGDDLHQAGAGAVAVLAEASVQVSGCPADVVAGVLVGPVEVQKVDGSVDTHAFSPPQRCCAAWRVMARGWAMSAQEWPCSRRPATACVM